MVSSEYKDEETNSSATGGRERAVFRPTSPGFGDNGMPTSSAIWLWAHIICATHALGRPIADGHLLQDLVLCLGETLEVRDDL